MNEDIALTPLNHLHMHYLSNLDAFPQSYLNMMNQQGLTQTVYKSLFFRS